jgi:hypothetical protein
LGLVTRAVGIGLLALVIADSSAFAKLSPAQKLFRDKLLKSDQVSHSIKVTLKKGGFVDPDILFADLTGEGKDDAVVQVDSGTSAGHVALYIFSSGSGTNLQIVYRNQRLYRAAARVNPGPTLVYSVPKYKAGDELCCPSEYVETTLKWSAERKKFGVGSRRTITP